MIDSGQAADSLNDVEDYLVSDGWAALDASGHTLCGDGSEWRIAIDYSIINRVMPELASALDASTTS